MKHRKKIRAFYFDQLSSEDLIKLVNSELPINIKHLAIIVDKIYAKYPLIDKTEISIIVRAVFESIREFLILGYIINFNKYFFDMKFHFFEFAAKAKKYTSLKVKVTTPPHVRKLDV